MLRKYSVTVPEGNEPIPPNTCVLPGITAEDFRRVRKEVWKNVWEEDGLEKPDKIKELMRRSSAGQYFEDVV